MAWGQESTMLSYFVALPTPFLGINLAFALLVFVLPGAMVWLDRQRRLPLSVPWAYLLVVAPALMYALLMINLQPNSYCSNILRHEQFRGFYVLFVAFLPLFAHMLLSAETSRPWLFGAILTLPVLFVFDITVGNEVLHLVYQNQAGEGIVYSGARAWECNHVDQASIRVAFAAKWRANLTFLILMPAVLMVSRIVQRRRSAQGQKENNEV
ncbi:MAG: hypothetical protein L7U48_05175 [Candidatus Poseidoniaceae archaeon]|nr:hypothetical protein [Candidatus Poseidoniaceae archaeon]